MNQHQQNRLHALSTFLKAKRANIMPKNVGLPTGGRRRTPGLRREEVAQLAGVSLTWYTWLEQGRNIQVSSSVLDAIASALRLTTDERKYLFALGLDHSLTLQPSMKHEQQSVVSPSLARILKELHTCPAIISDRRCQIVGWNDAAAHVFLDFEQLPPSERNLVRLLFTRKELQRLAVNWEHFASGFLSIFRSYYGQYVEDDWYEEFLKEINAAHPDFNRLWEQSRVSSAPEVVLEFRHAKAGKMLFQLTSFQVQGEADLRCSIYTPAADSTTESKLRQLMARG